jgi:hypothetical protein
MANWENYASLVQLGAGLNFAYAGLEVLLEKPLLQILSKNAAMINAIKTAVKSGERPATALPFFVYKHARELVDATSSVMTWISAWNPYVATVSGFLATAALFYIAEHADADAEPIFLGGMILASFGWFCVTVAVMGVFRLLLALGVPKALKSN